jgi:hypothetical protein
MTNEWPLTDAALPIGTGDFTVSAWVRMPARPTTNLGDILAAFDTASRRGFTLGVLDASPTGNHGNDRELSFGLDAGTVPSWTDLGRPSASTIMVAGLAVLAGDLYAATWEGPPSDRGHIYRLERDGWTDCGSPWDCNAVTRLAVHDGHLYAGVSRLRGGGSGMPDSANLGPGGHVLRYEGGSDWTDLGQVGDADSVAGIVPFGGDLYAIPMYSEGLYRLEPDGGGWAWCGSPGRRLLALGVHAGSLYGAGNDHADVASPSRRRRPGSWCRRGPLRVVAACSGTWAAPRGPASACSRRRRRSTRSRRTGARCTSGRGRPASSIARRPARGGRAAAWGARQR